MILQYSYISRPILSQEKPLPFLRVVLSDSYKQFVNGTESLLKYIQNCQNHKWLSHQTSNIIHMIHKDVRTFWLVIVQMTHASESCEQS